MAAHRIDAVLLTDANALLSGIVTDKALLEELISTWSFSDKYLIQSHEDPSTSRQLSTEKSDIDITSQLVDDTQRREPVYDTSPEHSRRTSLPPLFVLICMWKQLGIVRHQF